MLTTLPIQAVSIARRHCRFPRLTASAVIARGPVFWRATRRAWSTVSDVAPLRLVTPRSPTSFVRVTAIGFTKKSRRNVHVSALSNDWGSSNWIFAAAGIAIGAIVRDYDNRK